MIESITLTPELLDALGAEVGGCEFKDPSQHAFLENLQSCDVQAAPGNGKTTLLAAKLGLLSRGWSSRSQGLCIISHTNAARSEVEDMIVRHPTASRLMAYPHFTGTVTAFINQYLALPYLRGLGWPIRQIDDDVFAAEALRRYPSWSFLKWAAEKSDKIPTASLERWIAGLDLDPSFTDETKEPATLQVRQRKGQHGSDTKVGKALAELKAALVRSGVYRYADMTALAQRAIATTPGLADRLRQRFPLVILDEAQDTHGEQLRLLEAIFHQPGGAFQRLGDSNQTLYEDEGKTPTYWTPGATCIPLDDSRRFGAPIARFASRLTTRKAQVITGSTTRPCRMVLILFDEATIGGVLGVFAEEIRSHWKGGCADRDIWAVASRHTLAAQRGAWKPRSLVDYHPSYRSGGDGKRGAIPLCGELRRAALAHAAGKPPAEVLEIMAHGVAGVARCFGWKTANNHAVSAHNLWATLRTRDANLPRSIRRLLRDHILAGDAPWQETSWTDFLIELLPHFGCCSDKEKNAVAAYCIFPALALQDGGPPDKATMKEAQFGDVRIRLGSIHSVKGKTVDGILVVESELWKGTTCMDLETVLPHAFGVANKTFSGIEQAAATNIFVGVTRPREVLGVALRRSLATPALREAACAQGWLIRDLAPAPVA